MIGEAVSQAEWLTGAKWLAGAAAAMGMWKYLSGLRQAIVREIRSGIAAQESAEAASNKREIGPQPFGVTGKLEVRQAEEHVTMRVWEKSESAREKDRAEILAKLDKISLDLTASKVHQAKSRKGIYARLNAHENALYFMAGRSEHGGDEHAAKVIRERIEAGHKKMEDEDGQES